MRENHGKGRLTSTKPQGWTEEKPFEGACVLTAVTILGNE